MNQEPFALDQRTFVREYSKCLEAGTAGLFAGAGLSRAAGFVDWRGLLQDIAGDLGLDVYKETDLVALAQYYFNSRGTRSQLSQTIVDRFVKDVASTRNHELLARMPIQTIWTTNYDRLIEQAFGEAGKLVDIKVNTEDFVLQRARDVIIYKMHGDVGSPHLAVLTKDDYEGYQTDHELFVQHLKIDLVTKTFLFVGFSFTDPNLEYILSRVRLLLGKNVREHFSIIKDPDDPKSYDAQRFQYWKEDLRRFGIQTVSIQDYSEIEKLLAAISIFVNRKNVFVSGSSREFASDSGAEQSDAGKLARLLGQRLIMQGCNLVSGFGVGIGEQCVLGALRALYTTVDDARKRVIIRPFPTTAAPPQEERERSTRIRRDLMSRAGAAVFIAGSQVGPDKTLQPSRGVLEEFEIAKDFGRFIIPIGATGHAAEVIWKEIAQNPAACYSGIDVREPLRCLGDPASTVEQLADAVMDMVQLAAKSRANY